MEVGHRVVVPEVDLLVQSIAPVARIDTDPDAGLRCRKEGARREGGRELHSGSVVGACCVYGELRNLGEDM
jgi:hypothetical protein